jgi:hypothetical protein
MGAPNNSSSWENDVEVVASRSSSSTESESEQFLNQKTPFLSIQDMDQLDSTNEEDCPFCRRKPFWNKSLPRRFWKARCKHDRRSIREYNDTTSPVRIRRRTRRCTICFAGLTLIFALLYVNHPNIYLDPTNTSHQRLVQRCHYSNWSWATYMGSRLR